jgi:hypothetical protein
MSRIRLARIVMKIAGGLMTVAERALIGDRVGSLLQGAKLRD